MRLLRDMCWLIFLAGTIVRGLSEPEAAPEPSHVFDLISMNKVVRNKMTIEVTIPHDAVYKVSKTYRAIPLAEVLRHWLGDDSRLRSKDWEIIFECADGYAPAASMARVLSGNGFIAFADLAATDGEDWVPRKKFDGTTLVMAPYYLVWNQEDRKKSAPGPWPHNLTTLRIAPTAARYEKLMPKDKKHRQGFDLFRKNCMVCHAIDGGGRHNGTGTAFPAQYYRVLEGGNDSSICEESAKLSFEREDASDGASR